MPNYTYMCQKCGNENEVHHSVKEADTIEVKCPKCKEVMHRKPSPFVLAFSPTEVLTDWMTRNSRKLRGGGTLTEKEKYNVTRS